MHKDLLLFGDCHHELSLIPDDSIDLICIDPPYEINYQGMDWDKQDTVNWYALSTIFKRILKYTGNLIIFQGWSTVRQTSQILDKDFTLKNWIIYDRIKGRGAKTNLVSTREDILWYIKTNKYTYNKIPSNIKKKTAGLGLKNGEPNRAMSNVWSDISPIVPWSKERNSHPTQKPLSLMERLVKIYSNEGDIILDCFAGSGTTLVAAKNLNRGYVGIESNSDYFDIAKNRLSMFGGENAS